MIFGGSDADSLKADVLEYEFPYFELLLKMLELDQVLEYCELVLYMESVFQLGPSSPSYSPSSPIIFAPSYLLHSQEFTSPPLTVKENKIIIANNSFILLFILNIHPSSPDNKLSQYKQLFLHTED